MTTPPQVLIPDALFDGDTVRRAAWLHVVDGAVVAVGDQAEPRPAAAPRSTAFLMPGLVDAHCHVTGYLDYPLAAAPYAPHERALALMHEAGVAAGRDLGNHVEAVTNLAVVCRAVAPVEVVFSGPVIDEPPARVAHSRLVTDEPGAREVVRQLAAAGATWVKTYTGLRPALVGAVVDEARQHGLRVAHRPGRTDAMAAAALGVSSVEHLALCLPETPSTARPADILRAWAAPSSTST